MRKMHRHIELGEAIVEYLLPAAFDAEERALMAELLAVYGLPADLNLQAATWLYLALCLCEPRALPQISERYVLAE